MSRDIMNIYLTNHKEIGSGAFGKVFVGSYNDKLYAVKRRYIEMSTGIPPGCIHVNEIDAMCRFKHSGLLHANYLQRVNPIADNFRSDNKSPDGHSTGVKYSSDLMYMITDIYDGDLTNVILGKAKLHIIRDIIWQILDAISYLHQNKFIHRDIKPSNILYKKEADKYKIVICDFDMCIPVHSNFSTGKAMTAEYTPPEVLEFGNDVNYTYANDIWGIGCTIFDLLNGAPIIPFFETKIKDDHILAIHKAYFPNGNLLTSNIDVSKYTVNLDTGDSVLNNLVQNMLNCDPIKRFTAKQCMEHEFFKDNIPVTYPIANNFTIEPCYITENMAEIFDLYVNKLTSNQYYGFFLGLDILMRICTKKYRGNGQHLAICCLNLGMKYYYKEVSLFHPIEKPKAVDIESRIISNYLGGKIYRDCIYNHIEDNHADIYRYLISLGNNEYNILPCSFSNLCNIITKHLTQ